MSLLDIASLGKMLAQFLALFADCFHGAKGRRLLLVYLKGLLSGLQRKNVEAIALQQVVPAQQRLLSWQTDRLCRSFGWPWTATSARFRLSRGV